MTVMQFLLLPASDISGQLTPGHCSCQGQQQHWGWGVLRSLAHTSGTVCQLPFEPQRSGLWHSLDVSRPTCLTGTDSESEDYLRPALQIRTSSSSSSSSCGLSRKHCRFHERPPCLPILCSIIGSCQTNVEQSDIRFNCLEQSLSRSAWSEVPVSPISSNLAPHSSILIWQLATI